MGQNIFDKETTTILEEAEKLQLAEELAIKDMEDTGELIPAGEGTLLSAFDWSTTEDPEVWDTLQERYEILTALKYNN